MYNMSVQVPLNFSLVLPEILFPIFMYRMNYFMNDFFLVGLQCEPLRLQDMRYSSTGIVLCSTGVVLCRTE